MPTYRGCSRRGRLPVLAPQWKRRWSSRDLRRLRLLAVTMPYASAGLKLHRTPIAVWKTVKDRFGGLRRLALEARLITIGQLMRLMRKKSARTMEQWIGKGMPVRTLGGVYNTAGRIRYSKGQRFVKLSDVAAWLPSQPRLLITLDPHVRRMLRIELPEAKRCA